MKTILSAALVLLCTSIRVSAQTRIDDHLRSINWPKYQELAVHLMQEYLRVNTSNPPGNELAAADFIHRVFNENGISSTVFEYVPHRADLLTTLKGEGTLRPLVLLNHLDVVRADPTGWRASPFAGEILNGEIYGRGALDMKDEGLLQAMVMIIAAREHLPLKRPLIFLATSDEEVGDSGSAWIIDHHPELLQGAEYLLTEGGSNLVFPGGGTVYRVGVAEKAPFWLRLTATGRGGHGSIPIPGSATNRLVQAAKRVMDWQTPVRLLPSVEQYFHEIARSEKEPRASQFRNIRRALKDPLFARQLSEDENFNYLIRDTISLTVLKAGTQTNVIPDTASCDLDVRLLPGTSPQDFLTELRAVIADDTIRIEPISAFRTPNSSPTDTTLYRIIEDAVHRYSPQALVVPGLNSGYTESQMYRPLGITCYGFVPIELTPELEATEHAANERVPVEQFQRGLRMLYEVVARIGNE